MLARTLSAYKLKICILEKENDVAMGASKANSAIVHAGFDAEPGTLKAKLNVKGSEMMEKTASELGVKYKRNGSLVVGFNDKDRKKIEELYDRGVKNGVREISILDGEELHELDPNISPDAVCALNAPTGAIVCPYELTGPEYAWRYEERVRELGIPFKLNTMVLDITEDKKITATNPTDGIFTIRAKAIILAMGCRERSRGALNIAGTRPAGVYSAGTAQKLVNMKGFMPGKKVVILGSGDIGLIMARRMSLEGAEVKAVCELMPYSGGLARNIEQCLNDFNIPLLLSHTVVKIHGKKRVEGVTIAKVDEKGKPIKETMQFIECDTLLLSVGLIPENELTKSAGIDINRITNGADVTQSRETSIPGVFACGNVLRVHDLVDYVSEEAEIAGKNAALYIKGELKNDVDIPIEPDGKVRYTVPQRITEKKDTKVFFRVANVYENAEIKVYSDYEVIFKTSSDGTVIPVKTVTPIPKADIYKCMNLINKGVVTLPVHIGDIVIEDIFGSNIAVTENRA